MKNWKAIAGVVLVFILGALAGAIVAHRVCHHRIESILTGGSEVRREMIVHRMTHRLDLDDSQRRQLDTIMNETHTQVAAARRQIQPQVDEIISRSQDKVRAILRPDQRDKFEKFIAEWKVKKMRQEQ